MILLAVHVIYLCLAPAGFPLPVPIVAQDNDTYDTTHEEKYCKEDKDADARVSPQQILAFLTYFFQRMY